MRLIYGCGLYTGKYGNKVNKRTIPSKNDAVQSGATTAESVGDEKLKVLFEKLKGARSHCFR